MCGPSSALKAINTQIKTFTNQVTSEAGQIFGDASTVFNNIVGSLQGIVNGGPSQEGYSAAELSAKNAAAVNAGATEARNLKAAAGSAVGAIGGGNTVTSSGGTQATMFAANQKAAEDTANAENAIVQGNFETGRDNFFKAVQGEEAAPGVFSSSNQANEVASGSQKTEMESQQSIDNANNWWANDIMQLGTAAVGSFAGGLGGGLGKSLMSPKPPAAG